MIVEDAPDKTVTDLFAMVRDAYESLQDDGSKGFSFPILTITVCTRHVGVPWAYLPNGTLLYGPPLGVRSLHSGSKRRGTWI